MTRIKKQKLRSCTKESTLKQNKNTCDI